MKTNNLALQRWNKAVQSFKRALMPSSGDINDCVRINTSSYLSEVIKSQVEDFKILKMSPEELLNHQIHYDPNTQKLLDVNNQPVSTIGKESKGAQNFQIFIISKEGAIYLATHCGNYKKNELNTTHGSFLDDIPAETSGMIQIEDGKILSITNESGHYKPELLDMYRGIINWLPRQCFADNASIEVYKRNKSIIFGGTLDPFINHLETPLNYPLHKQLRDERNKKNKLYKHLVKTSVSMLIDCEGKELSEAIKLLSDNQLQQLANYSKNKRFYIFTKNQIYSVYDTYTLRNSPHKPYTVGGLLSKCIFSLDPEAVKILLSSNISYYFNNAWDSLLTDALTDGVISLKNDNYSHSSQEIMKVILESKYIRECLKISSLTFPFLHVLLELPNNTFNFTLKILQYPEAIKYLLCKDVYGFTALDRAKLANKNTEYKLMERVLKHHLELKNMIDIEINNFKGKLKSFYENDIIDEIFHNTFYGVMISNNILTKEMLEGCSEILLQIIENHEINITKNNKQLIEDQWHKAIVLSDIDIIAKSYVVQNDTKLLKELKIPLNAIAVTIMIKHADLLEEYSHKKLTKLNIKEINAYTDTELGQDITTDLHNPLEEQSLSTINTQVFPPSIDIPAAGIIPDHP